MDVQKETAARETACKTKECHCSICFREINDIESATHAQAGRYYCKNCRAVFGEKSMSSFVKRAF